MAQRLGDEEIRKVTPRITILTGCVLLAAGAMAQQRDTSDQTATRRLWDADFLSHRPAGAKPGPVRASSTGDAYVGVTVWRLRPSTKPVQEWTPERISSGTPLLEGEKIRIGIESARQGYLYVINRGVMIYGRKSDPRLIFPAQGLENRVAAGTVVTLPSPGEQPAYFEVNRDQMKTSNIFEQCAILVSPRPIPEVRALQKEQFEDWESKWLTRGY